MKTIAITMLLAFVGITVLGAIGFGLMEHGTAHPCPIASMQGTDCPSAANAALLALHHIFGVQRLTQAVLVSGAGVLILLLVAASLIAFAAIVLGEPRKGYLRLRRISQEIASLVERRIMRWLAMHNKRDTHIPLRAHGYLFLT